MKEDEENFLSHALGHFCLFQAILGACNARFQTFLLL